MTMISQNVFLFAILVRLSEKKQFAIFMESILFASRHDCESPDISFFTSNGKFVDFLIFQEHFSIPPSEKKENCQSYGEIQ